MFIVKLPNKFKEFLKDSETNVFAVDDTIGFVTGPTNCNPEEFQLDNKNKRIGFKAVMHLDMPVKR